MRTRTGRQPAPFGVGFGVLNGMAKKALGGPVPSFALNLLTGLSSAVTFSRGTNATMFDSQGRLIWAPVNLCSRSNNMTAGWTLSSEGTATVLPGALPSGRDATRFETTVVSPAGLTSITGQAAVVGAVHALTIKLRYVNQPWMRIGFYSTAAATNQARMWFNLQTGVLGTVQASGTASGVTADTPIDLGDGWYQLTIRGTVPFTSSTDAGLLISTATSDGSTTRAGAPASFDVGDVLFEPVGAQTPQIFTASHATSGSPYYGPRFNYDTLTLAAKGLLVEGQRTNLQPISQGATSDWTANFSTLTSTGALIHGNAAYTFTVTSVGTAQFAFPTATPGALSASLAYVSSVRVKKGNHPRVQFTATNNAFLPAAGDAYLNYNFDTDTLIVGGSALPAPTGTRTLCADGSVILTLAYTSGSAPTAGAAGIISLVDSDNAVRLAGTATNGATVHIFGVQLEQATFASTYIPTFGAAATRNSDYPTISGTNFSSWYNQSAGTFVVEGDVAATTADTSSRVIFGTSSGSFNDSLYLARQTALANIAETVLSGGVSQAALIGGVTSPNTRFKAAYSYAAADFAISVNGAAAVTQATGSLPATQIQAAVGAAAWGNSNNLFGHIRGVTYYPSRLTNVQLQALST